MRKTQSLTKSKRLLKGLAERTIIHMEPATSQVTLTNLAEK